MSFTAEVKNELSRVEGADEACEIALLSALVRICGSIPLSGGDGYSIRIVTETGAVARTVIKLAHQVFDLDTSLEMRRSNLHKSTNFLIEIPRQPGLDEALVRMGIIRPGQGLAPGIEGHLVERPCCLRSYVRGAFLACGFVADPRGDFHLEMAVTGEQLATDLMALVGKLGVRARLNHRRGSYAIYLKSFDDVVRLLAEMGGRNLAEGVGRVRAMKAVKNDVNRRVNAELANQGRSSSAAADQLYLIERADQLVGLSSLPPAVLDFCLLRRSHPDLSLRDLGQMSEPALSKSALYHRLLRLERIVDEAERKRLDGRV